MLFHLKCSLDQSFWMAWCATVNVDLQWHECSLTWKGWDFFQNYKFSLHILLKTSLRCVCSNVSLPRTVQIIFWVDQSLPHPDQIEKDRQCQLKQTRSVHLVEANRLFQIASCNSAKTLANSKLEQGHWQFMQAKPKTVQSITFASEQRSSSANNISRTASRQHFWSWKCLMYSCSFLCPGFDCSFLHSCKPQLLLSYDYVPPSHCWLSYNINRPSLRSVLNLPL